MVLVSNATLTLGGTRGGAPCISISPRLSRELQETLGDEAAEDLVTWMQQRDEQRGEQRDAMRADFAELRQEMSAGFAQVRHEIQTLHTKLEQRSADLIKWSFVFWVGAVSAIAVLAGVLR